MTPEVCMAISVISIIFCVAVVFKAVEALRNRQPYRFTKWDGGMLLRDVEIHGAFAILFALVLGGASVIMLVLWGRL